MFFCVHIHVDFFTYNWNWPEVLDFEHICSNVFAFVFNGRIYSNRNRTDKQKPDTAAKLSFTLNGSCVGLVILISSSFDTLPWKSIRQVRTFPKSYLFHLYTGYTGYVWNVYGSLVFVQIVQAPPEEIIGEPDWLWKTRSARPPNKLNAPRKLTARQPRLWVQHVNCPGVCNHEVKRMGPCYIL